MTKESVKKEIEKLREEIRQADYRYYILSDPEISDKEYDVLLKKLENLEKNYPEFIRPDSPTQRVSGTVSEGFSPVQHKLKMLSLDNTYSLDELREWETKIKKMLKKDIEIDYIVEPKIDGVSCSLNYKRGILKVGSTRGDGSSGEDVTSNIRTIKSIPLKLRGDFPLAIEVRGEVYIKKAAFERINKARLHSGESVFANPRNAASGSLKLLDPSLVAKRDLEGIVHSVGIVSGQRFKTHWEFLNKIKSWGLPIDIHGQHCNNLDEVISYCLSWQEKRDSLEYEVDGMVVKVNDISQQQTLGSTLKSPRWMVAYKFPGHQATTKLKKVEFGVGRTGIITPIAILEPVECGGVTISRTTLHNFDEIERLDVRQGDTVLIERAGEVIPKIIKVITSKRKGTEKKISVPYYCPVCSGTVEKEKAEEVYWYCLNPDCPAQLKRSLLHFASRGAMDIEGLGESLIEELVKRKMARSIVDVYKLKESDLLTLPLFKKKKAGNLLVAIASSKKQPLSRFLYGLGIKHVGEKAALILAKKFKTSDNLFNPPSRNSPPVRVGMDSGNSASARFSLAEAKKKDSTGVSPWSFKLSQNELEEIPEIGPIMASSIVRFFSSPKIKKMLSEFKKLGLNPIQEEVATKKSKIAGRIFIFTGELEKFSRRQAQKMVEAKGGKWTASVSKNIDFVVVGRNPGSKYDQANKLSLNLLKEKDFLDLLK